MGIDISKFSNNNDSTTNNNKNEENITEVQQDNFDIVEYTDNKKNELRQSKEVEQLTSLIEVDNPNTILQFGKGASEGISRVSDSLLSNIKMNQNEKNTEMALPAARALHDGLRFAGHGCGGRGTGRRHHRGGKLRADNRQEFLDGRRVYKAESRESSGWTWAIHVCADDGHESPERQLHARARGGNI